MAVTIYDIAKKVNTSAVTVSLALRDSKRVSQATKQKNKGVAKQLNYQPNQLARGLSGASTKTLAFVFNFSSLDFAHDQSYMELFHSLSQVAIEYDYKLFVHSSTVAQKVEDVFKEVVPYGVDGIVLGSNLSEEDKNVLANPPVPTILLGRDFCSEKTSCVVYGDYEGSQKAVNHLLGLGHRRIAFVGKCDLEASIRRLNGYKDSLVSAGIDVDEKLIVECHTDLESGESAAIALSKLPNSPTAVIAVTDLAALGVISGFRKKGLEVPNDISVVGFDNLSMCSHTIPALTSIDLDRRKISEAVMTLCIDMIKKQSKGERKQTSCSLVIRESTSKCNNKLLRS
ncbi:MAG: LacI family DNA-binding transcriptional regulator [Phycisphaerales bacterium]